ncbi:MAG: hypothetical protein JSW30_02410 [Dehalococcoidia bacterium]|nr:MAG: hypothetical protein JSW30_02410 [Dehalococcoidia bacterium]
MRFLIISKNRHPVPPEVAVKLFDAALAWKKKYQSKIKDAWAFAGLQAGGGIAEVESVDELDVIMTEFPMGPFGETEIYPLVDAEQAWEVKRKAAKAMTAKG